jgi:hypothetical protein
MSGIDLGQLLERVRREAESKSQTTVSSDTATNGQLASCVV